MGTTSGFIPGDSLIRVPGKARVRLGGSLDFCSFSLVEGVRNRWKISHQQTIVSFFGPWAPSTRILSISPVRLGPVISDMKLGNSPT